MVIKIIAAGIKITLSDLGNGSGNLTTTELSDNNYGAISTIIQPFAQFPANGGPGGVDLKGAFKTISGSQNAPGIAAEAYLGIGSFINVGPNGATYFAIDPEGNYLFYMNIDTSSTTLRYIYGFGIKDPNYDATAQLRELEGSWYGRDANLTIAGDQFQLNSNTAGDWHTGEITLNPELYPKTIDLKITNSSVTGLMGLTVPGIYKVENGILTLKMGQPGDLTRPTDFTNINGGVLIFGKDPNNPPGGILKEFLFTPMEFPFTVPNDISQLNSFALPDWGTPGTFHQDIDLHLLKSHSGSQVISPVYGTITQVEGHEMTVGNPPYTITVGVTIYINKDYSLRLGFEPLAPVDFLPTQMNAIKVKVGQEVKPGDVIGNLLVGPSSDRAFLAVTLMKNANTNNVTYFCPYHNSSANAKSIYERIAADMGGVAICHMESFTATQ